MSAPDPLVAFDAAYDQLKAAIAHQMAVDDAAWKREKAAYEQAKAERDELLTDRDTRLSRLFFWRWMPVALGVANGAVATPIIAVFHTPQIITCFLVAAVLIAAYSAAGALVRRRSDAVHNAWMAFDLDARISEIVAEADR